MNYTFEQKVKVVNGAGSIKSAGDILEEAGYKKAFIVTTAGTVKRGSVKKLQDSLAEKEIESVIFDKAIPDPPVEIVSEGAAQCKQQQCDCVVAIGGGSSIDAAKGINVLRFNDGSILDYTEKEMRQCPGLIVIPTTSGTGSELSNGAIITDTENDMKMPIPCANCMAEYAILDPELTVSMPSGITRETGLDAFSHAAEAYTSVLSNAMTDIVCESVMETIVKYLPAAYNNGNDMEAREKMQTASAVGGWMLYNACAHAGHSFAHVTGAKLHLVHGNACAYGLPVVLKIIGDAVPQKVKRIGEILGASYDGSEDAGQISEKAAAAYRNFASELELPKVPKLVLTDAEIDQLAESIVSEAFAGLCPVKVTKDIACQMVMEALDIKNQE